MSVMGGRAGGGGLPGTCGMSGSTVISDISTNSRASIFLVTLVERDAAALNGPAPAGTTATGVAATGVAATGVAATFGSGAWSTGWVPASNLSTNSSRPPWAALAVAEVSCCVAANVGIAAIVWDKVPEVPARGEEGVVRAWWRDYLGINGNVAPGLARH